MRLLIQRVKNAKIIYENSEVKEVGKGIIVYVGVHKLDTIKDIDICIKKIINLRLFEDENNKMNLSYNELKFDMLVVSNFTLYGDFKKGNRPSFTESCNANDAVKLYNILVEKLKNQVENIVFGEFQTDMQIISTNDGPVNLIFDTK